VIFRKRAEMGIQHGGTESGESSRESPTLAQRTR
jgi:hypothetical protein